MVRPNLRPRRILYIVNSDSSFLSNRLDLALAAQEAGAEVIVACSETGQGWRITSAGLTYYPIALSPTSTNPLKEIGGCFSIANLLLRLRPDIVHLLTTKPLVYGSALARLCRTKAVVGSFTGLGYVFAVPGRARFLRFLICSLYRWAFNNPRAHAIFQIPEDREMFVAQGLVSRERTTLIVSSGVDVNRFQPSAEPSGPEVVIMASRMITDKGVGDFVAAAAVVKRKFPAVRFVLCGPLEAGPTSISPETIKIWTDNGVVEYWGNIKEMAPAFAAAHLVVLPSFYREGVPRVLIEAAASGRALIASNIPGCHEAVRHGKNGLTVPPHDPDALAKAIQLLLQDPPRRASMGEYGRKLAVGQFSLERVINDTLAVYSRLPLSDDLR